MVLLRAGPDCNAVGPGLDAWDSHCVTTTLSLFAHTGGVDPETVENEPDGHSGRARPIPGSGRQVVPCHVRARGRARPARGLINSSALVHPPIKGNSMPN